MLIDNISNESDLPQSILRPILGMPTDQVQ